MSLATEAVKTLKAARELIENGWIKNTYEDGLGNYCAIGAIQRADGPGEEKAIELLVETVWERSKGRIRQKGYAHYVHKNYYETRSAAVVTNWNDAKSRTKKEVLAAFDAAIERASA